MDVQLTKDLDILDQYDIFASIIAIKDDKFGLNTKIIPKKGGTDIYHSIALYKTNNIVGGNEPQVEEVAEKAILKSTIEAVGDDIVEMFMI